MDNEQNLNEIQQGETILKVNIEEEMKSAYIDYSMSVIVSRALPDVRDGLKPVHRRVLFGMRELALWSNRPYKKSARIVGEVLGKYHPHGDSSVYFAMVRMAQQWAMRYPLIDGQGNFGSIDGDSPAAMRYTEARFKKIAEETLADLEKNTVDHQLNFDDTLEEPTVLPTKIPNLLVNGSSGIAVGMATNMPPHNLSEVVDGIIAYIDNNEITIKELMQFIKAPDFPTGASIYGYDGVRDAFETGRGRIVIRGKSHIETNPSGREKIIVTEVPYLCNKAELIEKVGGLVNDKKIEGIVHANDESDREGMRIVFALKKDANANVVLNQLYKFTDLQTVFSVNNIALVDGRPYLLNLKELIRHFVNHRHEVVIRRTRYELEQAEKKAHILEGLLIALDHLDEVIALIRASKTPDEARDGLMTNFNLSEIQAKAILEMRLQRLTGLERDKIKQEYQELLKLIEHLKEILADEGLRMKIIKEELQEVKEKYGDDRRTEIVYSTEDADPTDLFEDETVVLTISNLGYIKRTSLSEFRIQARGGRGSKGSNTRNEDFVRHLYITSMHQTMLFFTEKGKCFWLKVYEIPDGSKTSTGRAIQNLLQIDADDKVLAYMKVRNLNDQEYIKSHFIVMVTAQGIIKKTSLAEYAHPRKNGIAAINIREGDSLIGAKLTNGEAEILIAVHSGKAIRFNEKKVRTVGRKSTGVRAITLTDNDVVIGFIAIFDQNDHVLVVSERGYGKRSNLEDYRITNRGGKGVRTLNVTEKTGKLIAIKNVTDADNLMIINKSGITIRINVADLRVIGRASQGVRLIQLKGEDSIAAVAKIHNVEETEKNIEEHSDIAIDDNLPPAAKIDNEIDDTILEDEIDEIEEEEIEEEESDDESDE